MINRPPHPRNVLYSEAELNSFSTSANMIAHFNVKRKSLDMLRCIIYYCLVLLSANLIKRNNLIAKIRNLELFTTEK